MSRDHYGGVPKKRVALVDKDGNIEALEKGGDPKRLSGTATLSAGTVTVNDSRFVTGAYVLSVAGQHPYPTTDGFNWFVGDGYLTISGSNAGTYTVSYEVQLP